MTADQPRVGDTITTAEQLDEFFAVTGVEYVVVAEKGWRPWLVTSTEGGDLYAWSWREEDEDTDGNVIRTDGLDYPLTLLSLPPGEQPSPSVEDALDDAPLVVEESRAIQAARVYAFEKERGASDLHAMRRALRSGVVQYREDDQPAVPSDHTATTEDEYAEDDEAHVRHEAERVVRAALYGDDEPDEIDAASATEEFIERVVGDLAAAGLLATARPDSAPGSSREALVEALATFQAQLERAEAAHTVGPAIAILAGTGLANAVDAYLTLGGGIGS